MSEIIFISYRRGDGAGSAGRLYDRLEQIFGREQLFFDVDTIPPGQDFVQDLQDKVDACDVLLAVIGRSWIDARDEAGQRRLANPEDFVRIEVARALAAGKRVIPVLVDGASLPPADLLPDDLAGLADRQPVTLQHDSFKADCDGLATVARNALAEVDAARKAAEEEKERKRRAEEDERRRQARERWEALMSKRSEATPEPQPAAPQRKRPSRRGVIVGAAVLAAGGAAAAATRSFWYAPKPRKQIRDAIVLTGDGSPVRAADIHVSGEVLATGGFSGKVRTWSISNGELRGEAAGHTQPIWRTAFSRRPDPIQILTSADDHTARTWIGAELTKTKVFNMAEGIRAAAWSPDAVRMVTGGGSEGQIWDTNTGQLILKLTGYQNEITSAAYSPDGKHILTTSRGRDSMVWYSETGARVSTLVGQDWAGSGEFAPNSREIVTAAFDKTARTWFIGSMTENHIFRHDSVVTSARFSPNGEVIITASTDSTACLWDVRSGARIATLSGHEEGVYDARFSPDGSLAVTASGDKTARIWDTVTGYPLAELIGHAERLSGAMFSPDGQRILTWSEDGTARIWAVQGVRDAA
jgi:WD40 repeat protein